MSLTSVEREILVELLVRGDNVPGNIAESIGRSRPYVSETLSELEEKDLVDHKGRGVYRLSEYGLAVARTVAD